MNYDIGYYNSLKECVMYQMENYLKTMEEVIAGEPYETTWESLSAYEMGPKRDVLGELKESCNEKGGEISTGLPCRNQIIRISTASRRLRRSISRTGWCAPVRS